MSKHVKSKLPSMPKFHLKMLSMPCTSSQSPETGGPSLHQTIHFITLDKNLFFNISMGGNNSAKTSVLYTKSD